MPNVFHHPLRVLLPGVVLCTVITIAALISEFFEKRLLGQAWLESLVLAILLGTAVRMFWSPGDRLRPGIAFSAKTLLEVAVVLLGASVSADAIIAMGPLLVGGVAAVVMIALAISYGIGRGLGLPHRMAVLVACGNSICGNSAIAATAPVIGADSDDVAASIAFTAVLGVVVVLSLPLLVPVLSLSAMQYGIFAGLTVYAVPQVIAATAPVGALSIQIGTLIKLVRVLMLGPVILVLALVSPHSDGRRPSMRHLVPWFIFGFLLLMTLRSFGVIPTSILSPAAALANLLTVISMAALGLGVDFRVVARAGGRVTLAVVLSLLALGGVSLALIRALGVA
jgi:uncharacterized integral membrane protein (TIGR00698 family)